MLSSKMYMQTFGGLEWDPEALVDTNLPLHPKIHA